MVFSFNSTCLVILEDFSWAGLVSYDICKYDNTGTASAITNTWKTKKALLREVHIELESELIDVDFIFL